MTNDIKKSMDEKDYLNEILQDQKQLSEEKHRKIDQFEDDLFKIDKAIKRRLQNIERIDEDL